MSLTCHSSQWNPIKVGPSYLEWVRRKIKRWANLVICVAQDWGKSNQDNKTAIKELCGDPGKEGWGECHGWILNPGNSTQCLQKGTHTHTPNIYILHLAPIYPEIDIWDKCSQGKWRQERWPYFFLLPARASNHPRVVAQCAIDHLDWSETLAGILEGLWSNVMSYHSH